jgi:hypothetical protein
MPLWPTRATKRRGDHDERSNATAGKDEGKKSEKGTDHHHHRRGDGTSRTSINEGKAGER